MAEEGGLARRPLEKQPQPPLLRLRGMIGGLLAPPTAPQRLRLRMPVLCPCPDTRLSHPAVEGEEV